MPWTISRDGLCFVRFRRCAGRLVAPTGGYVALTASPSGRSYPTSSRALLAIAGLVVVVVCGLLPAAEVA